MVETDHRAFCRSADLHCDLFNACAFPLCSGTYAGRNPWSRHNLWVSEAIPIPVTALIGAVLCVIMGVAPARTVLAPFADPIVFLFIGSFIIAKAMNLHRLDRRFAMYIFSIKGIGNSPSMLLIACGGIVAIISMWISNTAATAIMLPICIGIISTMERRLSTISLKYRTGMMLMIAYGASVGGIGTPVGSPPNLIAIGMIESLAHYRITFFQWMALGVPMLIIMFIVLSIILMFLHTPPSMAEPTAGLIHDTDDDGLSLVYPAGQLEKEDICNIVGTGSKDRLGHHSAFRRGTEPRQTYV